MLEKQVITTQAVIRNIVQAMNFTKYRSSIDEGVIDRVIGIF